MQDNSIYKDIKTRCNGNIYIGVVGPVRCGKSTFIGKMIENLILPNIEDENDRCRTRDAMPQSANGRTVMTTEPKFIPDESVKIKMEDNTELNIKVIDCVGYLVNGALGGEENGETRLVMTPWSEEPMPFIEAAEIGTHKVITEHATIAMLVTTDGSFGDIKREDYIEAEERICRELTENKKPFAIILNSSRPESAEARELAESLEKKYNAPVALVSCLDLSADDIREILGLVLKEFPLTSITFHLPTWCDILPDGHPLYESTLEKIEAFTGSVSTIGDIERCIKDYPDFIKTTSSCADGSSHFDIPIEKEEYYSVIKELTGYSIEDDRTLLETLLSLSETEREYKRIEDALRDVNEKGYGIVMPTPEELVLEEPKLTRQSGGWGVKVSAHANSIHMIKTGIRTELCPVVGTEEQSEEVVRYLMGEIEEAKERVWESNMFGKSLYDLVKDGLNAKLLNIPDDSREKLKETLEKIVNEGANGLLCILL